LRGFAAKNWPTVEQTVKKPRGRQSARRREAIHNRALAVLDEETRDGVAVNIRQQSRCEELFGRTRSTCVSVGLRWTKSLIKKY
jgi:hypothetical protein